MIARSSEKTPLEERHPDQVRLFNEAEALAQAVEQAPISVTIPAHERGKGSRKKLSAALPHAEVVHDLLEDQKHCAADGTALKRIGEEISEQLDFKPAQVRVIRNIRPKYACPCCQGNAAIAPVPAQLQSKSVATPALLAHITTAKSVDGTPLYRQEPQFALPGRDLGPCHDGGLDDQARRRACGADRELAARVDAERPLIHCDETRLQVLKSDKAPTADHWIWVRASGPRGRRIVLFNYDASRAGAVPRRLLEGYQGILLTDGYEAYEAATRAMKLTHAGCFTRARRRFEEARKAQTSPAAPRVTRRPR